MIATVQYVVRGNEKLEDDLIVIPCHPSSGKEIIDVLINGYTDINWSSEKDDERGLYITTRLLTKGDLVQMIYKTLPRYVIPITELDDFEIDDFETDDFF